MSTFRRFARVGVLVVLFGVMTATVVDRLFPLDLSRLAAISTVVEDRDGTMLRAFKTSDRQWRLPVATAAVSPEYIRLLLDIEDKRFWLHPGFDPLSLVRASVQDVVRGHVVSGGSTLTMQVVRLLEPRPRTWRSKLIEIARAIQLEAHLGKSEILRAYLTLTPMGGNLQGVRAGSLAWFGKEPTGLSDAEAALLVALPQAPGQLRPDAAPDAATRARNRILATAQRDGLLSPDAVRAAQASPIPPLRLALPVLAPHLGERLAAGQLSGGVVRTTLDARLQTGVERMLATTMETLPRPVNLAAIVADWRTGAVLARAGSGNYFDRRRSGMVDMTRALRSPGSTLKPFIYGMAFDGLLAHPDSLVRDEATRFDDYAPHNFDGGYNGDVTVRQALQASLNLPAVITLQKLGPVVFTETFARAGLPLTFDNPAAAPGLPVALGGVGVTLETLVGAYAALADGGNVNPLIEQLGRAPIDPPASLLQQAGADAVVDILAGMPAPEGSAGKAGRIAYKTGTSYRFRDGWSVGFDRSRVIGVWMGRADGGSCAGCVGKAAAAILFRLFDLLPPDPLPPRPLAAVFAEPPPPALVRLRPLAPTGVQDAPRITFPIAESKLLVDAIPAEQGMSPTAVKLAAEGGQKPYRWLVDGRLVESRPFARQALWHPDGEGFSTVTVVDAAGRSDEAKVRVTARDPR